MIELKNLEKTYRTSKGSVTAIKDINITINDGEIFGIIGLSGAGKSTLVRCQLTGRGRLGPHLVRRAGFNGLKGQPERPAPEDRHGVSGL